MPRNTLIRYSEQRALDIARSTHEMLKEMPEICFDFIHSIELTTQPLTRFAYICDLRTFFSFLVSEIVGFSDVEIVNWKPEIFQRLSLRDLMQYASYLDYYVKDDATYSNAELSKQRKLSSLRCFFRFLFRNNYIDKNVSELLTLPKRHEKPILRMEIDEMARMLDYVETGEATPNHQRVYDDNTRLRDLTIITLFLGTGIRVSELVGIDIEDIDFSINGFLVTRKGGNKAILYFPDEVADALKSYLQKRMEIQALPGHEHALFLSLQKKRIGVRTVEIMVKKYATQAAPLKKRLSPHKLRSTFGTNLYHETGDIYLVAEVLGHSDVNTTRRHYAAMEDDRRRLAAKSVHLREKEKSEN